MLFLTQSIEHCRMYPWMDGRIMIALRFEIFFN